MIDFKKEDIEEVPTIEELEEYLKEIENFYKKMEKRRV